MTEFQNTHCSNNNIAESTNQFCNIDRKVSNGMLDTEKPLLQVKYPINNDSGCFSFRAIHAGHIGKALGKLKTSAEFGADEFGASRIVRIGFPVIAESLCDIFNLSLATCSVQFSSVQFIVPLHTTHTKN